MGDLTPEQIDGLVARMQMNGLRVREVVLDWFCPKGQAFVFEDTLWKSPQDATPHELATCRRQNEGTK